MEVSEKTLRWYMWGWGDGASGQRHEVPGKGAYPRDFKAGRVAREKALKAERKRLEKKNGS